MLGLLASCALLALTAAPALAKQDPKDAKDTKGNAKPRLGAVATETATATGPNASSQVSATATCPGKKRAVSGGFSTTSSGGRSFMVVHTSLRSDPRSWTNTAVSTPNQTLTTYVYCRRLSKALADVAASAELAPRTPTTQPTATATPACPGKRKAVSGGFSSTLGSEPEDFIYPYASLNGGGSWVLSGANNSDDAQTLTAHAYCAKGLKVPGFTAGSSSSGTEPLGGSVGTGTEDCAKGKLSAGGFEASPPAAGGALPVITQSQIVGLEWRLTSFNLGQPGPLSLEAQGICL